MSSISGYSARVLADSSHNLGYQPCRLTTLELTFPRFILPEFNTHRVFSRNSASSRAIPVVKQIKRILQNPFVPENFGREMKGMQAENWLVDEKAEEARDIWIESMYSAVVHASTLLLGKEKMSALTGLATHPNLLKNEGFRDMLLSALSEYSANRDKAEELGYLGVHKQTANRLLEPYTWHTVVVTATEWENFFALRANKDAQPEIQTIARMALDIYRNNEPATLGLGEWHLPLIQDDELHLINDKTIDTWKKISAGRCARVSYETHDGKRDTNEDIRLCEWLISDGHMSPLEHVATPKAPIRVDNGAVVQAWSGNFQGWHQFRKDMPYESDFSDVLESRGLSV